MAPFVMQIGGRDSPDQLAEWRFRIDRIAWIDVALPGPASGSIARCTNFDRSPCPERSAPTSRGGTSASVSAVACVVRRALATPAVVLARKRLRESGASSLLESTSRSQSFKFMNNLSVQSTNRVRQRSDQLQENNDHSRFAGLP